jgi:hypothetical protein
MLRNAQRDKPCYVILSEAKNLKPDYYVKQFFYKEKVTQRFTRFIL